MTMDYAKLSIKAMVDWIQENKPQDKELIKGFVKAANPREEEGNKKYDVKEAKRYFYNALKGEITFENAPREKKKSAWDVMMEWGNL